MKRARPFRTLIAVLAALPLILPVGAKAAVTLLDAPVAPVPSGVGCDPLDPAACLLPFPNDFFTKADTTTATGKRIDFLPTAMPRTGAEITEGGEGKPVDPTEWNRNDGFSPGSMVMTYVPGLDLPKTWGIDDRAHSDVGINEPGYFDHRDQIADIGLYQESNAPIVIIDAATGERHPFWSELDQHRGAVDAEEHVLIIRPAVNFTEGHRYIVALRNLKDSSGEVIDPRAEFVAYRDGTATDARADVMNTNVFEPLEAAGVARGDLYLAWDFTVASERNLSERMLHMRDDAFGRLLGDTNLADRKIEGSSPEFVVDSSSVTVDNWTDSRGVPQSQQYKVIDGRITVPNYMDRIQQTEGHVRANQLPLDVPAPGSRLYDDPVDADTLPDQNPVESEVQVPFTCHVPTGRQNFMVTYGHGLLGLRSQIGDVRSPRRDGPFAGCAVDWWGMSTPDAPTVVAILSDLSHFPSLPDRAQQGFLNFMFLQRAAIHPGGFVTDPAFKDTDGSPLLKTFGPGETTHSYYDGNSQGGIMGGSLVAVSPDIDRAILGVPGMNYSTLLNRSVDWEGELKLEPEIPAYSIPYYENYRDPIERQIGFSLIQMLWDRGEANGYAAHMTNDPYDLEADWYLGTPAHEVMLQVAFSDHQVSNHAAEVEARTIGAPVMQGLTPGRHWALHPFDEWQSYPYQGSALIYWDSGNATPPNGNLPPSQGGDPHGHGRKEPAASWQEAQFLLTGWMVDVCEGGYYKTDDSNGNVPLCHNPEWAAGTWAHTPGEI